MITVKHKKIKTSQNNPQTVNILFSIIFFVSNKNRVHNEKITTVLFNNVSIVELESK